jgi:hypothetical protein
LLTLVLLSLTCPVLADAAECARAVAAPGTSEQDAAAARRRCEARDTLFGRPLKRRGRFDLVFGLGGGNHVGGLYHSMTIGGTFKNEWSLSLMHTFLQNKGFFRPNSGPDLYGGWIPVVHIPLRPRELSLYWGIGPGGYHIQDHGIKLSWGVFYSVGLDFVFPVQRRTGPILRFSLMQAIVPEGRDQRTTFGANLGLGWAVF